MGDTAEAVRLDGITKRFDQVIAVNDVTLEVQRGEFVCLLGPSGCGKTTTLRIVAGFVEADAGRLLINGKDVSDRPPNKRDIGMVYQSYALFPHLTVFDNVAFGLRMRRLSGAEITERVGRALDLVRLRGKEERKPGQLSGGQQQRVALARALVIHPTVLLLDEPLSNLDAKLRKQMQLELKALQRAIGITTVHVTHDQEEALTLADRAVILNEGRIEQIGPPRDLYAHPRNVFVADFLGRANFLTGRVTAVDLTQGMATFTTERKEVLTVKGVESGLIVGSAADAFIRPERIVMRLRGGPPVENLLPAEVVQVIFTGSLVTVELQTEAGSRLFVDRASGGPEEAFAAGEKIDVILPAPALRLLDGRQPL
ncbi:MAG TPA: ABC transporter ATP-binding protein [Candidatus Baltobacteraceae bacterium]|nr:ABC transporter ATP-binding protein [Candidatus Baltobacteraceae bacterium]